MVVSAETTFIEGEPRFVTGMNPEGPFSGCVPMWSCTDWGLCTSDAMGMTPTQTRTCESLSSCNINNSGMPALVGNCTMPFGNYSWPWTSDGLYHSTRIEAVFISFMDRDMDAVLMNVVGSFGDLYYRSDFDWGLMGVMFMHITMFIVFYVALGLLIRHSKKLSKSSMFVKLSVYFVLLPILVLLMTLLIPSV